MEDRLLFLARVERPATFNDYAKSWNVHGRKGLTWSRATREQCGEFWHLRSLCGDRYRRRVRREYIRTVWLWHTFADNCPDRNWPSAAAGRMPGHKKKRKTPPAGRRMSHISAPRARPRDGGHSIWRRSFVGDQTSLSRLSQSPPVARETAAERRAEINSRIIEKQ